MSDMKATGLGDQLERAISRRGLLKSAGAAALTAALAGCGGGSGGSAAGGAKSKKVLFVGMAYGEDDPFHRHEMNGVRDFVKSLGPGNDVQIAHNRFDARLQVAQIEELAIKRSQYDAIVVHGQPITPENARPMVLAAKKADVYITTEQFKPSDLHPWDLYDKWISHITYDSRTSGRLVAEQLFEAMEGKGKLGYISGAVTDTSAKGRWAGTRDALEKFPNIELIEIQPGDWSRPKANQVTQAWLRKHGKDLTGIACGNDNMAMGALAAVKATGRVGEVLISGQDADTDAVQVIADGDAGFIATCSLDSYWLGMIGPALAWKTINGEIDPAKLTNDQREWFAESPLVGQKEAKQRVAGSAETGTVKGGEPDTKAHIDEVKSDVWARHTGPANIDWEDVGFRL
jgi:ribose transport system substrate-binding protein